jgi:hypothetical protein
MDCWKYCNLTIRFTADSFTLETIRHFTTLAVIFRR